MAIQLQSLVFFFSLRSASPLSWPPGPPVHTYIEKLLYIMQAFWLWSLMYTLPHVHIVLTRNVEANVSRQLTPGILQDTSSPFIHLAAILNLALKEKQVKIKPLLSPAYCEELSFLDTRDLCFFFQLGYYVSGVWSPSEHKY